jgi:O-acetyl-ADP-ribose deacetylase
MTDEPTARHEVDDATITVVAGDITGQEVDAVVNAANTKLQHGGGVAAAIAKAGGPTIQRESDAWVSEHGELEPGVAAVTSGGEMPARWVIHVAGPVYEDGSDDNEPLLRSAVAAALDAAADVGAASVAFPAISAGVYGYPRDEATATIADEAARWLGSHGGVDEVRLVGFDQATADDFAAGLERLADG